jgi:hypothetical protein
MEMRIIKISECKHCEEVLLSLGIARDGNYFVKITAWHTDGENNRLIQETWVRYKEAENPFLMYRRFIADFSEASANDFANSFSI